MFRIIQEAGFKGYVGIEYEGSIMNLFNPEAGHMPATEGIAATKKLLEKVWAKQ